jgi:RNA polymerase sigma factor (sigma-70 family)
MEDRHGLKPLLQRVLADRERSHDPDAWNQLLARLRPIIRALLVTRVTQEADASDLTHDVQQRLLRYFPKFRGQTVESFLAWMDQITAKVLAGYWGGGQRPTARPLAEDLPAPSAEPEAFDVDRLGRVLLAMEKLPPQSREIIQAFYLGGQSCVQIAARLRRSAVWVRVTKLHAVRELCALLGGDHAS